MATYTGTPGNDIFTGADNVADTFLFAVANLGSGDNVTGGGGSAVDTLQFTTAGTITAAMLGGVTGIERVVFGGDSGSASALTLTTAFVHSAYGQPLFQGSSSVDHQVEVDCDNGADTVDGSAVAAGSYASGLNSLLVVGGKGDDTITGTQGDDIFEFAAADLNGNDVVRGGGGDDTLQLTTAGTIDLSGFSGIETIRLANGTNNVAVHDEQLVAGAAGGAGASWIIGGSGDDTIDASALTGGHSLTINSGAGDDTLIGGAGDDTFQFTASDLTAADSVSGGLGFDYLQIYGAGAADITKVRAVEKIILEGGTDGDQSLSLTDATVSSASGARVAISVNPPEQAAESTTVDGSALTDANAIDVDAEGYHDTLIGGAGNDSFTILTDYVAYATINGGAGTDTLTLVNSGTVTAAELAHVTGIERIVTSNGISLTLPSSFATNGTVTIQTGVGSDLIDGSAISGAALDITSGSGSDTLRGGSGDDIFRFAAADLTSADSVAGGGGTDTLAFSTAGTLNLAGVTGIEAVDLADGTNSLTLYNAQVSSANGGRMAIVGGAGNDTVNGSHLTGGNAIDVTAGSGDDTLTGGAGNDTFRFRAADLYSSDSVNGGAGIDTLILTGTGTANLASVRGIEQVMLANGGANTIALTDATVSSATGGRVAITGGSGNDTIDASRLTGANAIDVVPGTGNDTLLGGAGNDTFTMRSTDLTAADTISGGAGTDTLHFVTGGTIGAAALANVTGIERIVLANLNNNLVLPASFATKGIVTIQAGSGNDTIDGSAISGAGLDITAGSGSDTLTGGAASDTFRFGGTGLTAADHVDGGGGSDTLALASAGAINLVNVHSVEFIRLADGTNTLALNDALAQSSSTGTLSIVGGAGADSIDASQLTSASVTLSFQTGDGDDNFRFSAASLKSGDSVIGGAGFDTVTLTTPGNFDLSGFGGIDRIALANGTNTVMFGTSINDVTGSAVSGTAVVAGGSGNDTIDGSKLTQDGLDVIAGGGTDTLTGGKGADTFEFRIADLTAADTVNGGGANGTVVDTLKLLTGGTLSAAALANVTGIERITFANADTSITLDQAFLDDVSHAGGAADRHLAIVGGAGNDTVDGSAITGAAYDLDITAGSGNDTLLGGAGVDTFRFGGSGLTAADHVDGGAGSFDSIVFASAGSADLASVTDVESIYLFAGTDSLLVSDGSANSVAGRLVVHGATGDETVDGRSITSSHFAYIAGTGADTVYGGAGPDQFSFGLGQFDPTDHVSGGGGSDALSIEITGPTDLANVSGVESIFVGTGGTYASAHVTIEDATVASASGHTLAVSVGSDGVNVTLDGSGVTSAANALVLTGSSQADTLIAGAGTDRLTGGAGADTFEWLHRDGSMDTVVDFSHSVGDKLAFAASAFDFNGAAFDTAVTAGSTATDITGADLVIFTGGPLSSVADVQAYLSAAAGGSVDEGLFVAGTNSAGHTVLYHALDASFTDSHDVAAIADLGTATAATSLSTGDFLFV